MNKPSSFMCGLGTWKIPKLTAETLIYESIKFANVRHIDCACDYGNEIEVGNGIRRAIDEGIVGRNDLFITNKLWNTYHHKEHVELACKKSLSEMKLEYFDLYLIHFPISLKFVPIEIRYPPEWIYDPNSDNPRMIVEHVSIQETWTAMENLVVNKLVKNIGVCNFNVQSLMDLLSYSNIKPFVNQIERHPLLQQNYLVEFCKDNNIHVTAFSPLGSPSYIELNMDNGLGTGLLEDELLKSIAVKFNKSVSQIILRWNIQQGISVIPKSSSVSRISENVNIFDFELSAEDMSVINAFNKNIRFNDPVLETHHKSNQRNMNARNLFENIREKHIKTNGVIYLDNAGAPLPRTDMIADMSEEIIHTFFANPHSSKHSADLIDLSRREVLKFFGAESQYDVIFTSNATNAMKLVGECFPWTEDSILCYPINCHTSFLGIRAYANNVICYSQKQLLAASKARKDVAFDMSGSECLPSESSDYGLLLLTGEDNFTGERIELNKNYGEAMNSILRHTTVVKGNNSMNMRSSLNWLTFVDAAKLAASSKLCLDSLNLDSQPNFLAVSFYKIFGYPSGVGALLVRNDTKHLLKKKYFGGGTVDAISSTDNFVVPKSIRDNSVGRLFEDGTINFHGILALKHGFKYIDLMGGMENITNYTSYVKDYLLKRLESLTHISSNQGLVKVYDIDYLRTLSPSSLGPTISFNLYWSDNQPIGYGLVSQLAGLWLPKILFRVGCFCNPGSCQTHLNISTEGIQHNFENGRVCDGENGDVLNGQHTGAIRVSLGYISVISDCDTFVDFLTTNFLNKSSPKIPVGLNLDELITAKQFFDSKGTTVNNPDSEYDCVLEPIISRKLIITEVIVYPVKSCKGWSLPQNNTWFISSSGHLYLDRQFAVIDVKTNRVLTQKNHPVLSEVIVDIVKLPENVHLKLSHYKMSKKLIVSVDALSSHQNSSTEIKLCGRSQSAIKTNDNSNCDSCPYDAHYNNLCTVDGNEWFTELLNNGIQCELVRINPSSSTLKRNDSSFVNDAQLLILSQESIDSFKIVFETCNDLPYKSAISSANFRPNLIVAGGDFRPHQEDSWKVIQLTRTDKIQDKMLDLENQCFVDQVTYQAVGPCSRCSAVNLNENCGVIDGRILETLGLYRKNGFRINFGQYFNLDSVCPSNTEKKSEKKLLDFFFPVAVGADLIVSC